MRHHLELRDEPVLPGLLVVRLGAHTLDDASLHRSAAECYGRWGIWGFSVLEVPNGDFEQLAEVRPIVGERRQFLIARGAELVNDGFPLLPTLEWPHWTLVLAEATPAQFARVRTHFTGPIPNPAHRSSGQG